MTPGRKLVLTGSGVMGLLFLVWWSMTIMKSLPEGLSSIGVGVALIVAATIPALYILGTREASIGSQLDTWRHKRLAEQEEVRRAAPVRVPTGPVQNPGGRIYKPNQPQRKAIRPTRTTTGTPKMMRLNTPPTPLKSSSKPMPPKVKATAFLDAEMPPIDPIFVLQPTSHAEEERAVSSDGDEERMDLDLEGFTGLMPTSLHRDLPSEMTDSAIIRSIRLAVQSEDEPMPIPIKS